MDALAIVFKHMHSDIILSCIIPDDGLGIKAETLDCLMNWLISVVDYKSINGWNSE